MMMNWLRGNKYAAILLTLLRIYVGWEWLTAGWHKIAGAKPFNAAGFMKGAIAGPVADNATHETLYPTFIAFLKHVALPNVKLLNVIVPWGELLVGAGLLLGALTTTAVLFGLLMNFMYMFAGTVSTNPWLILLGFFIVAAGANAGKFGVDHYILPYLHERFKKHDRAPKLHARGRLHT
ncbi:thiosulfate dehydrogenase [quinone] large subunit [Paenibacillus taihuensis]|uniref:Thiosulfate dehydrogenase [quinone] large subunit n=1 Tax=Paenibacillus taihuensis TaxID=1156355 RepID=A0A3D9Q3N8_9BACL|nr:DoxX family membrane protein [Paenibacillus taihuensis]REE55343.1 thiosulfate dehydrogenase [quinone] large subunit [Paenibacillus taihuensis]